jgi:hypothetical protein
MKEGSSRKILLMAGRLSRRSRRAAGVGRTARLYSYAHKALCNNGYVDISRIYNFNHDTHLYEDIPGSS